MYGLLTKIGFEIPDESKLIGRVEYSKMHDTIIEFFTDPSTQAEDVLLFYFSGHGVPDTNFNIYLASSETNENIPSYRGFLFDELTNLITQSASTRIVTILDCCHSGELKLSKGTEQSVVKEAASAIDKKSRVLEQNEGKYLLSASLGSQNAYELQEKGCSIFTHYLMKGLNGDEGALNDRGDVSASSLGNYVYREIVNLPAEKRQNQKPLIKVEGGGDLVLASYPTLESLLQHGNYKKEVSEIIDIMNKGRYGEALTNITTSKYYNIVPRLKYLEACCRSKLAKNSSDRRQENIDKGFKALESAIDNGYIRQVKLDFGYPRVKAISDIVNDWELDYLQETDLPYFCKSVKITERNYRIKKKRRYVVSGGGSCLVSTTAIRLAMGDTISISQINVGDSVLIFDEHAKSATVKDKFCKKENRLICINNKITVSHSQAFLTAQGFKKAADLKEGDLLMSFNEPEPIITINRLDTPMDVYTISLSAGHLFYAEDFIVHNKMR